MMAVSGSLHFSHELGICKNHGHSKQLKSLMGKGKSHLLSVTLSSHASRQDSWSFHLSDSIYRPINFIHNRCNVFKCNSFLVPSKAHEIPVIKIASTALMRSCNALQDSPLVLKLVPAVGIIVFAVWGLGPLMRQTRNLFPQKSDNSWRKSSTHYVLTSYLQPLLLWTGATLICRALDPIILPTETSQVVKQRLLNFVRSLSTVLAFACCLSSLIQQAQKFFMETSDSSDTRNMGFQFAGKAVYTAVWVAAVSLFMELLGFSTQKWLTAGGLGTVLLTLAGREIFTNFLSSAMIHATRPFVVNEWIQTRIEGYEVSGTVEHVGWWSPTIVRGEDREAVHIPNHKFTVNVVRNLSQKTHWRIKTHLAISHLDVNKINSIVADMRKVLAKNPQVEQQRLHRRVFLDNINPENQALLILISCFVKTSHFEEYLCVKEAILLDLLRVISHHRARLATPIRTVQKIYSDADFENIPFADSAFARGGVAPNRPLLLIEPPYRINGEDKTKTQTRSARTNGEQDGKVPLRPTTDTKADAKAGATPVTDTKARETLTSEKKENVKAGATPVTDSKVRETLASEKKENVKAGATPVTDSKARETLASEKKENVKAGETPNTDKKDPKGLAASTTDPKMGDKVMVKSASKSGSKTDSKVAEVSSFETRTQGTISDNSTQNVSDSNQPKKAGVGNARHNSPVPSSDTANEKSGGFPASPQSKQEDERSTSRPALEENIVLGVALEGSKRTLPIEEGTAPTSTPPEKELAAFRNSNESLAAEKDKKDNQKPTIPSTTSGDQ